MNSMTRQNDTILKEELPRSVGAQYATGDQPIVTGTIALMKSIKRDLTVQQARDVLFSTGADVYGWIPPMVLDRKSTRLNSSHP